MDKTEIERFIGIIIGNYISYEITDSPGYRGKNLRMTLELPHGQKRMISLYINDGEDPSLYIQEGLKRMVDYLLESASGVTETPKEKLPQPITISKSLGGGVTKQVYYPSAPSIGYDLAYINHYTEKREEETEMDKALKAWEEEGNGKYHLSHTDADKQLLEWYSEKYGKLSSTNEK